MSNQAASSVPILKSFALTHILYDPADPTSIPLTLLSLSPIFLFVAYFTLIIFTRRLTVIALASGSVANEILSLALKRALKGERPYKDVLGEVGEGYGMPSSHSQAAGFLLAWGVGYWWTQDLRARASGRVLNEQTTSAQRVVRAIYLLGLALWSILVAYSRWHLRYHSPVQVIAGYSIGIIAGTAYFYLTEYIPLRYPQGVLARLRAGIAWVWTGLGGIGGHELGDALGGWGEGHFSLAKGRE